MVKISLKTKTLKLLHQYGAYIPDTHCILTGSDHSDTYFNKDKITSNPILIFNLSQDIAESITTTPDAIAGPISGGYCLALFIAYHLSNRINRVVEVVPLEKIHNGFRLKRGTSIENKNLILIDDVVKTGMTLQQSINLIKQKNGQVLEMIILINWRSIRFDNLVEVLPRPKNYSKLACPMCQNKKPIEFPF